MKQRLLLIPTILLSILTIFQVLLIAGLPWGRAAWGGQYEVLPTSLRIGSVTSIGLYILFYWVLRRRLQRPDSRFARVALWLMIAYSFIGVVMNLLSSSIWEKTIWAPVALVLAITYLRVYRAKPKQGGTK